MRRYIYCLVIVLTCVSTKLHAENIVFTDANVKSLCVINWDTDGDGELSEDEAAAVSNLGTVFKNNSTITSFNELQYFTNVTLHIPASSVSIYKTTVPWSSFKSVIEVLEKCATPTISYKDGELTFDCETEGVKYVSTITAPESTGSDGKKIDLSKSFKVSVYAEKYGYQDSDIATQNVDVHGLKGDVNGDGEVTAQDASLILQKVAGK